MQLFQLVERNLLHTMRLLARVCEAGEHRELPGVSIASTGVDSAVFNAAFLSEPVLTACNDLERRIALAAVHFRARGLRWSFWVCEHLLDPSIRLWARAAFLRHGFRLASENPGMVASHIPPPSKPLPAIECRRVLDSETRLAFCLITSAAFQLPLEVTRSIYDSEKTWRNDMTAYIGYLGGSPIATAATVTAAGAIGLYSVATLPGYQRRGMAEKLVRHALLCASQASGIECSVLESTPAGLPLYRRLGYSQVTSFAIYIAG